MDNKFPLVPVIVNVPTTVCVPAESKVNVLAVVTLFVKLLNVLVPRTL